MQWSTAYDTRALVPTLLLKSRSHLRGRLPPSPATAGTARGCTLARLSLCPGQEFVYERIDLLFRVSRMNNDPDPRLLYHRIRYMRSRVPLLQ